MYRGECTLVRMICDLVMLVGSKFAVIIAEKRTRRNSKFFLLNNIINLNTLPMKPSYSDTLFLACVSS